MGTPEFGYPCSQFYLIMGIPVPVSTIDMGIPIDSGTHYGHVGIDIALSLNLGGMLIGQN